MCRSHDRKAVTKAVKFASTVTEFPDYSSYDDEAWSGNMVSKSVPTHKHNSVHSGSGGSHSGVSHGAGHSSSNQSPGHSSSGPHDRNISELSHSKTDSRKSAVDK